MRPPAPGPLRELAQRAAGGEVGVVFAPNLGKLQEALSRALPELGPTGDVAGSSFPDASSSTLPLLWARSAPGLLATSPEGLEARLDVAPGRAMLAKLLGHIRGDAWLRGGVLPGESSTAVWWERGAGRSTSRWAVSRPTEARRLLDVEPGAAKPGTGGGPAPAEALLGPDHSGTIWVSFPEIGPWHVWFEEPVTPTADATSTTLGQAGHIRVVGARGMAGAPVYAPVNPSRSVWAEAGLDGSDLLGSSTWLLWAQRDEQGARVTLWRESAARRDGASVDIEVPRIARWLDKPAGLDAELPAKTVVRRLGAQIRDEALADGGVLVGYDVAAIEMLRQEVEHLRTLTSALPEGGSVVFARPAALGRWWGVARDFGRFGRPEPLPWWAREPMSTVLDGVGHIELRWDPESVTLDVFLPVPNR